MGFSFNGTTSQSMGLATRITNEYRMPDLRNNTITMPGRHGVFDFGETVSERKILISCFIPPGKTDEQFLSKKDDIIEWLNPDNGLCQLILDKEPGMLALAAVARSEKTGITMGLTPHSPACSCTRATHCKTIRGPVRRAVYMAGIRAFAWRPSIIPVRPRTPNFPLWSCAPARNITKRRFINS